MMNVDEAEMISKALSDLHRLRIVRQIKAHENDLSPGDPESVLNLSGPSNERHIKILTDANVIVVREEGRTVKYRINDHVLEEYVMFLQELRTD